jgi:hypothetical protein
MKASQIRTLESFYDTQRCLRDYGARLEGAVAIHLQKLDHLLDELSSLVAREEERRLHAKELTRRYAMLREALLRDHMLPIARIASADLPVQRRVEALRMPRGRPSAESLAGRAEAMAQYASAFAKTFTAAGLEVGFADALRAAADAMLTARYDRISVMGDRRGVVQTIASRLTEGRRIAAVIDAFVRIEFRQDPLLVRQWGTATGGRIPNTSEAPAHLATRTDLT